MGTIFVQLTLGLNSFISAQGFSRVSTVSYTHLDVYKRQAMMTAAANADDMLNVRTGSETGIKMLLLDAVRLEGVDICLLYTSLVVEEYR